MRAAGLLLNMFSLTTVLNLQNAAIIKSGAICFSLLLDNQLTASINDNFAEVLATTVNSPVFSSTTECSFPLR